MAYKNYGFIKTAIASPKLKIANITYNREEIEKLVLEANKNKTDILVFPELCLTGYTCADLFQQEILLSKTIEELQILINNTKSTSILYFIGLPLLIENKLYNCAMAIQCGNIIGIVPKTYIPNYKEFYEKRWFTSGYNISKIQTEIDFLGKKVSFGNIIFNEKTYGFGIGIEICEDLWTPIPVSSYLAIQGATIIVNLSASNDIVGKSDYRRNLISQQSAKCICGYLYTSSGVHESTTDIVFAGDGIIAENGAILKTNKRFNRESTIVYCEIDVQKLQQERMMNKSFGDASDLLFGEHKITKVNFNINLDELKFSQLERIIHRNPFVPSNKEYLSLCCEEIFNIQVAGLAKRIEHIQTPKAVIGVSGGLDSTLALLVVIKTFDLLGIFRENIIGITMPGFGTTEETYQNSIKLMESMKITKKEIDIKGACLQHFKDIEHDENIQDITYENTQARERTQILMDYANKINGIVIGTGDLSELALGWCTYNGDHMSMYAVNTSIPKTLVKFIISWIAQNEIEDETKQLLQDILDTPISPELLPANKEGNINQKTEEIVGPYELHDFFLFYMLRYGMSPEKIFFLAQCAWNEKYSKQEIKKWMLAFYRRFFSQQFKRSCIPDGPKVGSVSLSPRGDWRMPTDADGHMWIKQIETVN